MKLPNIKRYIYNHFFKKFKNYHSYFDRSFKTFQKESETEYLIDNNYLTKKVSLWHFLTTDSALSLDNRCLYFNRNYLNGDNVDEILKYKYWSKTGNTKFIESNNIYNFDNNLDGIFEYAIITIDNQYYILISIHANRSGDIRAGYSNFYLFKLNITEDYPFLINENLHSNVFITDYDEIKTDFVEYPSFYPVYSYKLKRYLNDSEIEKLKDYILDNSNNKDYDNLFQIKDD